MRTILLTILITLSYSSFSQGKIDGFYRGKSNISLVIGGGFEDSKNYIIGRELSELNRTLTYLNLFVSYGLTDNLDVQVSLPYLESDDNKDFQDISLFSKYRFYQKRTKKGRLDISFAFGFSTPFSNYNIGGLYDIGQRATIIDGRALLHYKTTMNWFATIQSGYSFKLEEVPSSIPFVLKIGKAANRSYFDVYYDYQHTIGGIDYRGTPAPQNFRQLGVDYQKVGGTFYHNIFNGFGGYVTYAYLFTGRNTFVGPSYGIGLVYDFRN